MQSLNTIILLKVIFDYIPNSRVRVRDLIVSDEARRPGVGARLARPGDGGPELRSRGVSQSVALPVEGQTQHQLLSWTAQAVDVVVDGFVLKQFHMIYYHLLF